ncbi:MAG TPA: hypothetical protein VME22_00205 [Solirubrobacteraceae bacterium]|nr:hypothetical protein [Solirubrobacteraceae bacterium]
MDIPGVDRHISEFVVRLLRTGVMLSNLAADLVDAIPDGAYPGEDSARVVLEMLCGTIATVLESADPRDIRRATELIDLSTERTIEHLRLTSELSRRREPGGGGMGRAGG